MAAPFDLRSSIQLPVLAITVFSSIPPPLGSHGSLAGLIRILHAQQCMPSPLSLFSPPDAFKQWPEVDIYGDL